MPRGRIRRKVALLPRLDVLLMAALLLVSCDGTVYHRFGQVDSAGWATTDTLSFIYEGSDMLSSAQAMEVVAQARCNAAYAYKNLFLRVESSRADGTLISTDTLCCEIYDDNGRRLGSTAGTIYQTASKPRPIAASCTDTLILKLSHIMGENPLQGVLDVGVRLAGAK